MKEKELEKVTKYQDLVIELKRMWSTRAMVVPIEVGALGAIYRLRDWLGVLHVDQKTTRRERIGKCGRSGET